MNRRHALQVGKGQGGSSTVEFIVLSLVLVPFMLIVPLLGAYGDIAQATTKAARYIAFEGMVHNSSSVDGWKSDVELATDVRRRFFSTSAAPIKSGDAAGEFDAHRNPLWYDHKGSPLIDDFDDIAVSTERDSMSQPFGALTGPFNLPTDNVYTGRVSVTLSNVPDLEPFDKIDLTMTRSATVLVDAWTAPNPDAVKRTVKEASSLIPVPSRLGTVLGPLMDLYVRSPLEANAPPPEIGKIEPDRVPVDRLKP